MWQLKLLPGENEERQSQDRLVGMQSATASSAAAAGADATGAHRRSTGLDSSYKCVSASLIYSTESHAIGVGVDLAGIAVSKSHNTRFAEPYQQTLVETTGSQSALGGPPSEWGHQLSSLLFSLSEVEAARCCRTRCSRPLQFYRSR